MSRTLSLAVLFEAYLLEMYRRGLIDQKTRRGLQRLDRRLLDISQQLDHITAAEK
jgi:hypothetical protein